MVDPANKLFSERIGWSWPYEDEWEWFGPGAKPDNCATGVGSIRTPESNAEIYSSLRGVSQISLGSRDPDELT